VGAGITNPYGQTKFIAEIILKDFAAANPATSVIALRYFNPVGAHASGTIGEDPRGVPNNLMPFIQRVAVGKYKQLAVHGSDYATPDGTAQRDYIHVVDLVRVAPHARACTPHARASLTPPPASLPRQAKGHVKALEFLGKRAAAGVGGFEVVNLGTGRAVSVLDMVKAFEEASGKKIPYALGPRRAGDVPAVWADASKAEALLGWTAELGLAEMCESSWKWASENPNGYDA
jgi:UDP-glucose 4-epimerase